MCCSRVGGEGVVEVRLEERREEKEEEREERVEEEGEAVQAVAWRRVR